MSDTPISILAFAGSLREKSYNKSAVRALVELAPEGVSIEIIELNDIPLLNEDLEPDNIPKSVVEFRKAITGADALVVATPEYNHDVSGVLKNALDWASREYEKKTWPLKDKPVAIMGASPGRMGTIRAQEQLKALVAGLGMHLLVSKQVLIPQAYEKFDDQGVLIDEKIRESLRNLLSELHRWALQLKK